MACFENLFRFDGKIAIFLRKVVITFQGNFPHCVLETLISRNFCNEIEFLDDNKINTVLYIALYNFHTMKVKNYLHLCRDTKK